MSAVSVDAGRSVMEVTEELQRDTWTRSGNGLPLRRGDEVGVDGALSLVGGPATAFLSDTEGCADFAGRVTVVVARSGRSYR